MAQVEGRRIFAGPIRGSRRLSRLAIRRPLTFSNPRRRSRAPDLAVLSLPTRSLIAQAKAKMESTGLDIDVDSMVAKARGHVLRL